MIGRRREDTETSPVDELASIWATDAIPVDDEPTEFDWSSTRTDEAADGDTDTTPQNRVKTIVGAAVATAVLLVIALLVWPRSDDPVDDAADVADSVPATLDTLPGADTTAPDDETESELDDAPDTTENTFVIDEPERGLPEAATVDVLDTPRPGDNNADQVTQIEVPPALAALTQPTELVMIVDRQLVTVSLPSGRVRRSPVPGVLDGSIIVSPTATYLSGGQSSYVVTREGDVLDVELDLDGAQGSFPQGWLEAADGSTTFVVSTFGESGADSSILVSDEGVVDAEPDIALPRFNSLYDFVRSDGNRIINDAGGVYRFNADGTAERIAEGRASSVAGDFILLRECSQTLECSLVVADLVTGDRRIVDNELLNGDRQVTFDLAPDGGAVAWLDNATGDRVGVDFDTGVSWTAPPSFNFSPSTNWASDSSGLFDIGGSRSAQTGSLRFVSRASGEVTDFGGELGLVTAFAVRHVDAELPPFPLANDAGDEGNLRVAPALPIPSGLDLLVLGSGERMAHVDIDAEVGTPWPVPRLVGTASPEMFANGPNVTVLGAAVGVGFVSTFGNATSIDLADSPVDLPPSPRFAGPFPGTVWAPGTSTSSGVNHRLYVVDRALPAVDGAEIVLPGATLLGGDSRGGLIAEVGGDIFVVLGAATTQRLTTGDLVALGSQTALVRECDATLRCSVNLLQRDTGTRTALSDEILVNALAITPERQAPIASTIAPDGSAMLVEVETSLSPTGWMFVDLRSQESISIPEPAARQPIIWNSSGSHVAYTSNGELHIYDRANAAISTVQGLGEVRAITVSPDDFTAAGNS